MLTPRKLIEYVSAEPFRPFRISMASGQTFEVRHPENIAVSRSAAKIFSPTNEDGDEERWHDVSLMLMEFVEVADQSRAADQN